MIKKYKKGDEVIVKVGKDKGKGGIIDKEMPIHISNILAYDSKSKKSSKVGFKVEDGKKVRILKTSGEKY
jgi:large subunit ribosomal protein L24